MKRLLTTNYTNFTKQGGFMANVLGINLKLGCCQIAALLMVIFNCELSIINSAKAQEAFYIYRNDGDFDGFFYDRVVRMNLSKVGVDSVEYDYYVVQEIETPDSIYRIPLVAIDSIGFQQPEIKFNPKLKHMDELGITPYVTEAGSRLGISKSIPANLLPKVGDVVAGFNSDIYPQNTASGWVENNIHSYVVKISGTSEPLPWYHEDDNSYYFTVESIEDLSDVFEQYITVEDIVVDDQGHALRRIAGCDSNGMPRRADSGSSSLNLIDIDGTISRSWNPSSDISIDLSAEMNLKVGLHVAYNISWRRAYVKLSRDFSLSAKPSVGFAVSKDFEFQVGDLAKFLKAIPFPASFPIFQTAPLPDWFIRGGGTLEARFTFPKMQFGMGESIIVDTDLPYFPVRYELYKKVDEEATPDGIVDTGSTSLKLWGYFQTGLKFTANVETASWLQKILAASIELDLYCGPRVDAAAFDIFTNNTEGVKVGYGEIKVKKLAIDLEAKASAALMWRDPEEKTFFSTEWAFGCDTLYSIPKFIELCADYSEENGIDASVVIPNKTFLPYRVGLGMYNTMFPDDEGLTDEQKKPHEVLYADGTCFMGYGPKEATAHFSTEGLRTGTLYILPVMRFMDSYWPADSWNGKEGKGGEVHIPHVLKLSTTSVSAPAKGGTYTITYTYSGDYILVDTVNELDFPGTYKLTEPEGDYDPYSWYYSERTGTITIHIPPNKSDESHQGQLRVYTDDYKYNHETIITVSQAAGPYEEE